MSLPNLLMISGDASIASGRCGVFHRTLERFAPRWRRVDVIVPRPARVIATTLFDNVFVHPSSGPRALHWRHVADRGLALHQERSYALMTSHDHGWQQNGLGAWLVHRRTGTPYISEIHGLTGHPRAATFKAWAQGKAARLYVRLVKDHVLGFRVVNAVDLPDQLTRMGVRREQILIRYALYIDHDVFQPRPAETRYDAMFCGRADPNKGGSIALRAFARLVSRRPSATLLMVTAGAAEGTWRRLADRLGVSSHVTWHGWVSSPHQMAELYRAVRMLICPSLSEGGPRVTAEAMACGVPVISTAVGLVPELIDHGHTGLIVDWSPAAVEAAMEHLLADSERARAIGRAGRERVIRFERNAVIDAYASGYLELAERARRTAAGA